MARAGRPARSATKRKNAAASSMDAACAALESGPPATLLRVPSTTSLGIGAPVQLTRLLLPNPLFRYNGTRERSKELGVENKTEAPQGKKRWYVLVGYNHGPNPVPIPPNYLTVVHVGTPRYWL